MYFLRKIILKSANMVNGCKCAMENGGFCGDFGLKKTWFFFLNWIGFQTNISRENSFFYVWKKYYIKKNSWAELVT